jgi:hypothetical protein
LTVSNPTLRRRAVSIALGLALIGAFPGVSAGQLAPAREYEIKAGFLFNFAKFVDWPDDAFKTESNDLRLEVIGHDPFDGALDRLVAGKFIKTHRVVIGYSRTVSPGPPAHLVFVSGSEQQQLPQILAALKGAPTLTVSDIDRFADRGGVIGLLVEGQSVRFAINRTAASQARLRVSSTLLSLAKIVGRDTAESPVSAPGFDSRRPMILTARQSPWGSHAGDEIGELRLSTTAIHRLSVGPSSEQRQGDLVAP